MAAATCHLQEARRRMKKRLVGMMSYRGIKPIRVGNGTCNSFEHIIEMLLLTDIIERRGALNGEFCFSQWSMYKRNRQNIFTHSLLS